MSEDGSGVTAAVKLSVLSDVKITVSAPLSSEKPLPLSSSSKAPSGPPELAVIDVARLYPVRPLS